MARDACGDETDVITPYMRNIGRLPLGSIRCFGMLLTWVFVIMYTTGHLFSPLFL
jgi:hypothetical protein